MASSRPNNRAAKDTNINNLRVLEDGEAMVPYNPCFPTPTFIDPAKIDDGFVIKEFKNVPGFQQEYLIKEMSSKVHQDVSVEKLPDDTQETYNLRCFTELFKRLPSDNQQRLKMKFYQRYCMMTSPPAHVTSMANCAPANMLHRGEGQINYNNLSGLALSGIAVGIGQQIVESIVNGESSLEKFKVKTLDLRGGTGAEQGSSGT